MTARLRIGLVGAGTMGARHARIVDAHPRTRLAVVIDHHGTRAHDLARTVDAELDGLFGCDAVIVATTTSSHHVVAAPLLAAGIPVLVEKPVAHTAGDFAELVRLAEDGSTPMLCGFAERHHPAWLTALDHLATGDDEPWHVDAERRSPPVARAEGGEVLDLMIHDLDLVGRLFAGSGPGTAEVAPAHAAAGTVASARWAHRTGRFEASRRAPVARRRLSIAVGARRVDVDLLEHRVSVHDHRGTAEVPVARRPEPLAVQWDHFLALLDGAADVAAERESIVRAHRLAYEIDAHRPATDVDGLDAATAPDHSRVG